MPERQARVGKITHHLRPHVCWLLGMLLSGGLAAAAAPVIDSFTVSSTVVAPGEVATLTVEAHDPDCPGVCGSGCGLYVRADFTLWSATGGSFVAERNGTNGSPYSASADWQAPAQEGTYTLGVSLADSGSFLCGGRQSASAALDVLVTVSTNQPPVVESLTAHPLRLFPGGSSELTCVASDPDGDAVTYSWQTDAGTVTVTGPGTAVFTAGEPGVATVTCTATDSGGAPGQESILIAVTGAVAEKILDSALVNPQRLAVDSMGDVYVADRRGGGITVLHLGSGELIYRLPVAAVSSVAVDWRDNLLVGSRDGAWILGRHGGVLRRLSPGSALDDVSDVAVDPVRQRYGVLYRKAGRVVVYAESGAVLAAFGATGDGADQLKSPQGLAVTPAGDWVVADGGHGLLKVFRLDGSLAASFGGRGGGAGEFVQLDDVAVDAAGLIYASDSFQDWVQVFNPDGSLREVLGTYGGDLGEFKTAAGLAPADAFGRLLGASLNASRVQVFQTRADATPPPAPAAQLSTDRLSFAAQAVGTTSPPQRLTLTNRGDAPLGVRGVEASAGFTAASACAAFLDPGASCTVAVTLTPAAAGVAAGTLAVDTSAGRLTVGLTGSGFVPAGVVLSPGRLDYSDQELGTISPPKAVVLSNPGTEPLLIASVTAGAEYLQTNGCGAVLPGGGLCVIGVTFAPSHVADSIPGSLTVISNAAGSPHTVALDGRGIPGPTELSIADVEVDEDDAAADFAVTLSGPGSLPVTVDFATRAGSAAAGEDFEPVAGTLTIPAGATTATVTVPIVDDDLLEPDEETFTVELANAVNTTLADAVGAGTVRDDELCLGPNLLANPGAEERPDAAGLPGWTVVAGSWQRLLAAPEPAEGRAFFAAAAEPAELAQDVDVSAYVAAIDDGAQRFAFEGRGRTGGGELPAAARIVVEYRSFDDTVALDTFDSGAIDSPEAWQRVSDLRLAPAGTRWIRVRLLGTAESDAYFDALALVSLRAATLAVDDVAVYEGDFGTAEAAFTVRLACPFSQEVRGRFATADAAGPGAAVAGEDYLATGADVVLEPGETVREIPVEVLGDEEDEGHEIFFGDLTLDAGEAVLLAPRGLAVIVNDDFCPRGVGYWKNDLESWPVDYLVLGGVEYDEAALLALLGYHGPDAAAKLARQLVATRLNLAVGSEPAIRPVTDEADAFLAAWPPGSDPRGDDRRRADELKDRLEEYNETPCPEDD